MHQNNKLRFLVTVITSSEAIVQR